MPRRSAPVTFSILVFPPGPDTVRNATSSSGSAVDAHAESTNMRVTVHIP
jgi:hypothetical protein